MMLRLSFGLEEEAQAVESAVNEVLDAGYRTKDIYSAGKKLISTTEMVKEVKATILDNETILNIMGAYI
jgi:3-isopropylmalate dehydrogenase